MIMSRIEQVKRKVDELYQARNAGRADWADWLYMHHVFVVADYARQLAERFHADQSVAVAAALLHDIADVVMKRDNSWHEEESMIIARKLLQETGFSDEEITVIVDDAIRLHSCCGDEAPKSLEGRILAAADALAHLKMDFYRTELNDPAVRMISGRETFEEIKLWALPKIDRDFYKKISFDEVREETRPDYEGLKEFFSRGSVL